MYRLLKVDTMEVPADDRGLWMTWEKAEEHAKSINKRLGKTPGIGWVVIQQGLYHEKRFYDPTVGRLEKPFNYPLPK